MAEPFDITGRPLDSNAPAAFGDFWKSKDAFTRTALGLLVRLSSDVDAELALSAVNAFDTGWRFVRNKSYEIVPDTVTPLVKTVTDAATHVAVGIEVLRNPFSWAWGCDTILGSCYPVAYFARVNANPKSLLQACACAAGVLVAPRAFTVASTCQLNGPYIAIAATDGSMFVSTSSTGWMPTVGTSYEVGDVVSPFFAVYSAETPGDEWWQVEPAKTILQTLQIPMSGRFVTLESAMNRSGEWIDSGTYSDLANFRSARASTVLGMNRAAGLASVTDTVDGEIIPDFYDVFMKSGYGRFSFLLTLPDKDTLEGRRARDFATENKIIGAFALIP